MGKLHVLSRPHTTVYIDGRRKGTTPLLLQVRSGSRRLRLVNTRRKLAWSRNVRVRAGRTRRIRRSFVGRLTVRTSPWVYVYQGRKRLGMTPIVGMKVLAGTFRIRLVRRKKRINHPVSVNLAPGGLATVKKIF